MSCAVVAMAAACAHQPSKQPAPAGGVTAAQPPASPPGAPRRRGPANPVAQDSLRRTTVDSILRAIAGRENEPAGKVFKNVKLMATMSARAFLENMDVNYSRGLGWTCGNCHAPGSFDGDSRKNKRIARQMQQLTVRLNATDLPAVKELDDEYEKVTCVMCHRGSNEPKGTMPVPAPLAAPAPK